MTEPPTITADMVLQITTGRRDRAERLAAYATARWAGLRQADARRETGVKEGAGGRYERFLPRIREAFDLPPLPVHRPPSQPRDYRAHGRLAGHRTNHTQRGVTNPNCEFCRTEAES
jgi:hypothetical protein